MSEAELFDPLQGDSLQGVFELNQREASVMAPEMSEAELFDSLQGDSLQGVFDIDM